MRCLTSVELDFRSCPEFTAKKLANAFDNLIRMAKIVYLKMRGVEPTVARSLLRRFPNAPSMRNFESIDTRGDVTWVSTQVEGTSHWPE